jgi:hypothetical protein
LSVAHAVQTSRQCQQKRNQLNVERHNTYIHQANRKAKSLEMHRAEVAAAKPAEGSEEEFLQRIEEFMTASGKQTGVFKPPTDEELLRLAGGDKDMVLTGKAGMELRTVLAQRVSFAVMTCVDCRLAESQ